MTFSVVAEPVSGQAKDRSRRADLKSAIGRLLKPIQYLLSGEVRLSIEWVIHEKERYETDRAPDVDGILKPLLDALTGPDGLIIDDSQVQSVCCSWIDYG